MKNNLEKNYNPREFEGKIYKNWESCGCFKGDVNEEKKPFTIVMPPPNITGQLHMGHALDQTLQDVIIRFKRMNRFEALWIPGTDHASIATEVKVQEKIRREEGLEKEDLGREEFLKRVWEWKREFGSTITEQCRRLGDSCDWSKERFTMDEGCSKAVKEFFVRLYEKGYIYRSNRLINWCPVCKTTLSDAEVEHEDVNGNYWYIKYPLEDGTGSVTVATSRPETIFADVAIAVNPEDERYEKLIGKNVKIPVIDRSIPIIADSYPDPEKGTGAVKITPAADHNDFEVGRRHDLEMLECMDFDAKMTSAAGKYEGMDRYRCRKEWIKELDEKGFLEKIEEVDVPKGSCYRCHTTVEPMLSEQWFVAMKEMAKPAIEAAKKGEVKHVPERFEKIYLHWLENIRDWCISRQLWWGHRIPAYYCDDCNQIIVDRESVQSCPKCGNRNLRQEEDVLDTWFSSALWPFSTLGWPEKTPEYEYFYPTDVLVTGYDIIFFWVVRMVFSALEMTGEAPFSQVYVHGLVRDEQGRKMSKSLGNGVNPLDVIDEYGADALRFMLISQITPGNDMRYIEDRVKSARNFANKLWNASRFVIMNIKDEDGNFLPMSDDDSKWREEDRWIVSTVNTGSKYIEKAMDRLDLSLGAQKVYDLIWSDYCDWYIEMAKRRLYGDDEEDKKVVRGVLRTVLIGLLKMLHPYMPFITEEIYGFVRMEQMDTEEFIMCSEYPKYREELQFQTAVEKIEIVKEIVRAVRNIRAESEVAPSKKLRACFISKAGYREAIDDNIDLIKALAGIDLVEILESDETSKVDEESMSAVIKGVEIRIPLSDLIDFKAEMERLEKEKKRLEGEVSRCEKMLSNTGFISKAPKAKIDAEKEKLQNYKDMLEKVIERIETIEKRA